jgi:ribosomal protein L11 methyltransferase
LTAKPLWQISIETSPEAEEAVAELLGQVFKLPSVLYSNAETGVTIASIYREGRGGLTPAERNAVNSGLQAVRACGLNLGSGKITVRRVGRENWKESWKRHFKAIEISPRLLVKPGWIRRRPRRGQAVVVLDPGLSFGTGNHPTTAFCLHALANFRNPGRRQSLLDIGTGSGILAIAAAKLGYRPVRAFDFDPEAVRVARQNAHRNRVTVEIARRDITKLPRRSRAKYNFICANLISNLLLAELPRIMARLRPGGALAVAGILKHEFPVIQRACRLAGLRFLEGRTEGEWRSGVFQIR